LSKALNLRCGKSQEQYAIGLEDAINEIIEEHGGIPKNLKQLALKRLKEKSNPRQEDSPVAEEGKLLQQESIQAPISTTPQFTNEPPQEGESWGDWAKRNLVAGGTKAAAGVENLLNLPDTIANAVLSPIANFAYEKTTGKESPIRQAQQKAEEIGLYRPEVEKLVERYVPKDYLKPRHVGEKILHGIAQDLPIILATAGAGALPAIGRSASSNTAMKTAEEIGLGPLGQLVAGSIGGSGFDLFRRGGTPGKLRATASDIMKKDYDKAAAIAPKLTENAQELEKNIGNLRVQAINTLPLDIAKKANKELARLDSAIHNGKINVNRAWNFKKLFNKLAYNSDTNEALIPLYKKAGAYLNDVLESASKSSPDFGKYYNRAEDLYLGLKAPSKLRRILEENTDLEKLLTSPLAKLGLFGAATKPLAAGKAALNALSVVPITKYTARSVDFFTKSKTARQLFNDILKDALSDNKASLASNLTKLNNEAEKYEDG
jgi:hypothetical protein